MFEGLLQPTHLLLVLIIVLIIFGPGKLPGVGRALGESIRALRESASGDDRQMESPAEQAAQSTPGEKSR